ncbi:MAG: cell division ATP-binding protein FtsE [Patescibacteria group bacterium]|nr:cell division ATP-binding protein FtsE [Patescibacteria group bacterium]
MIRFEGVSKTYGNGVRALADVDLEVHPKDFLFLIGPSGAGKTTLLKLIYCEEKPEAGKVFFEEKEVTSLKRPDLFKLRRDIGVVFQDFRLLPTASVYENVSLVLEVLGKAEKEISEQATAALDLVGLSEKVDNFPWQLSGGERQRVALARALVGCPKVILADEPTAEVDPALTWGLMEILDELNKRGTTVIVATHDSEIVNSLKKRVVKIDRGRIIKDDKKGTYV